MKDLLPSCMLNRKNRQMRNMEIANQRFPVWRLLCNGLPGKEITGLPYEFSHKGRNFSHKLQARSKNDPVSVGRLPDIRLGISASQGLHWIQNLLI